jgi:hypothetical protein
VATIEKRTRFEYNGIIFYVPVIFSEKNHKTYSGTIVRSHTGKPLSRWPVFELSTLRSRIPDWACVFFLTV